MDDDSSEEENIIGNVFFEKYKCIKKLGEGSFGKIYEAEYNGEHFALKFENKKNNKNLLELESVFMNYLSGPNIPEVKAFGTCRNYNILVMQLMGQSLEDLIRKRKNFSIKTVCLLGYQIIRVLEYIHNKHIIHRDIKPNNFVIGLKNLSKFLYLLDFGLAKKYRSSETLEHNPLINNKKLVGTARYASINAMKGFEQSRRDDLEAVGYILIYFLKGKLPWQNIHGKSKEEIYQKILKRKIETSSFELCIGFPKEFEKFVEYTRKLKYEELPNYGKLRRYFIDVVEEKKQDFDYIYDWSTSEERKLRKKEYLEGVKEMKKKKNKSLDKYLSSKYRKQIKHYESELNDEEIEDYNSNFEEENSQNYKYKEFKGNHKLGTKEDSLDIYNKNDNKNSDNRTLLNSKEIEDGFQKENEEICCTQACEIF